MPFDSSADLLFRIIGDSSQGQAELAAFRASLASNFGAMIASSKAANTAILYDWAGNPIKRIGDDLAAVANVSSTAGQRMVSDARASTMAFRGLGQEIGVKMPLFVGSWLSSLGGVSTVMAAAFAPIAVIGLIEVLSKIPDALQKGIDYLHGWDAAAKKAFAETTKDALDFQERTIHLNERLRAIALIGAEGMEKYNLEAAINSKNLKEVSDKYDELNARLEKFNEIVNWKPAKVTIDAMHSALLGVTAAAGPSHMAIEQAKKQIELLKPAIKLLADQIDDLTLRGKELAAEGPASKKTREDFTDLTRVLDQVQSKLAGTGTAKDKVREQITRLGNEAGQARLKLEALNAAGKLSPDTYASQMAAWEYLARMIPELQDRLYKQIDDKRRAEIDRLNADISSKWLKGFVNAAGRESETLDSLRARLAQFHTQTLADKHLAIDAEIDAERRKLDFEGRLKDIYRTEALAALTASAAQRHAKLDAEAQSAADTELARLGEQLERIEHAHQTTSERIAGQYQADVAKFAAAEERKSLLLATSEFDRVAIEQRFAAIRAALLVKEQQDLQALKNSTGWQGVFGADFTSQIRGNENLSREWSTSSEQSHMLVRVAMESSKEQAQQAFGQMAQGMGSAIAQSLVYSKSIGAAMQAAAKSTLESIATRDIALALDALGWGFYDLAMHDYSGAASAFHAAAIFGAEGLAAGLVGRAIPATQSSTGAGAALPSDTAARQANLQSGTIGAPTTVGPHVTINLYAPVVGASGVGELCSMLSDAVLQGDHTLTATNTKTGVQVTR